LQQRVRDVLQLYLNDNTSALLMQSDGQYLHPALASGETARDVQTQLLEKICGVGGKNS